MKAASPSLHLTRRPADARVRETAFSDVSHQRGALLLVTEKQQSRRRPHRCRRPANRKRVGAENLCGVSPLHLEPFEIEVPQRTLSDLRERIRYTRWPPPSPEPGWEQGAELSYVRGLLKYWADGFDWRLQERRLNEFAHFRGEIDGVRIHFVHERRGGIPLILTHGWPSTFVEHLQLAPLLPEFDLVIPSLPGYGFSERPPRTTMRDTARLWHRLMQGLGYKRYGAQGGDFGASVTTYMALDEPAPLLGIHLHMIDETPYSGGRPQSATERDYREAVAAGDAVERGYSSIQSTKPQTVAYGLNARQPASRPGSSRRGPRGATRLTRSTAICCSPT